MTMSGITSHVLDTARGLPAEGMEIILSVRDGVGWRDLTRVTTDGDGRARVVEAGLGQGIYRMRFESGAWAASLGFETFHPHVDVAFVVRDPAQHLHVPLLLSPYGYTTYRGS